MKDYYNNAFFWQKVDTLLFSSKIEITKNKNDVHNEFTNLKYPVAYGYLKSEDTTVKPINLYLGEHGHSVEAIIITVDILKKDMDIKLLFGCNKEEVLLILYFLNQTDFHKTVLIKRGEEILAWAVSE